MLFLGAGASQTAKHPTGDRIPQGEFLRDLICDKFLGGELKQKPLTAVASMAASEAGLSKFQEYIHQLFLPFEPTDFHLLMPKFRWRAIATTNFDLVIEKTYGNARAPLQNLVKTVKDDDNFDRRCCTARSKSLTSLCRLQSHPAQYVSGIPSAVILLSISHPIRCSTRCLANVRVRISGPMIAL